MSGANGPAARTGLLIPSEAEAYARRGYRFPLRALSEVDAWTYRQRLEAAEGALGGPLRGPLRNKPHLLFTWAQELIRLSPVLDAVEAILGPDLLVWSSGFFIKDARDPSYVSWHQDATYWGLSHPDVVTAWIALSVSDVPNGCMRVIPGSHLRDQIPHRDTFAAHNLLSRGQEVAVEVDETEAVNVELRPGEFSLHHVRIVHGSDPNRADYRRIGYAVRYVATCVRQTAGPRDSATLVRGTDRHHHFEPEPAPRADLDPEAVEYHRRLMEQAERILYRGTDRRDPS